MGDISIPSRPSLFSRTLRECRKLYVSSGELCEREYPHLLDRKDGKFVALMDDLHRALVLKIYCTICEADRRWTKQERYLAEVLCHHLWGQWLSGDRLHESMREASAKATGIKWYSLVRPFDRIPPLRDRVGQLETIVARLANIVARADGHLKPPEAATIRSIQMELDSHLKPAPLESEPDDADAVGTLAIEQLQHEADDGIGMASDPRRQRSAPVDEPARKSAPAPTVEEALDELDRLIGLAQIKHEVRSLANFLKLQQRRTAAGLPETDISLHMVFTGNPGTGKTTVARIVGKIYAALGVLEKGHLIETDRSGLVAEYAGQTGPKTNQKIDEAMGGILFVDEAYSLIAASGDDPYGHEAVQTLLKRAEDDRDRLVIILAGYPDEMASLLASNPGLSSRFNRQLHFVDYTPVELARIFGMFCRQNHYRIAPNVRLKVLQGLSAQHGRRDRHFGNGRTARNLFEQAIRNMANRLAGLSEITEDQLQTLLADDLHFDGVPADVFVSLDSPDCRIQIDCPGCGYQKDVPATYLGKRAVCPKCNQQFSIEWGSLTAG